MMPRFIYGNYSILWGVVQDISYVLFMESALEKDEPNVLRGEWLLINLVHLSVFVRHAPKSRLAMRWRRFLLQFTPFSAIGGHVIVKSGVKTQKSHIVCANKPCANICYFYLLENCHTSRDKVSLLCKKLLKNQLGYVHT